MSDHAHQGARPVGTPSAPADSRVPLLDEALRAVEVGSALVPDLSFMRDSLRVAQMRQDKLNDPGNHTYGVIIHALPYANWYKVQCADGAGWIGACKLTQTGVTPIGPRETNVLPPNTQVLIHRPTNLAHGFIVGVIPPVLEDGTIVCPDWISQGGGTGIKREEAHKFPIKSLYKHGGVIDWSSNRPLDETPFTKGWITPTGLAFTIDDFMIQTRVNEQCGLWFCLHDSWTRLAGMYLTLESATHEETALDDEGESRLFRGVAAYPWEALGLYAPGTNFTAEFDDKAVQYDIHKGKVDLPDGKEDVQPLYRYQEYGGYLGQGHFRTVMKPGREAGIRQYQPEDPDEGLFREHIGLEGSYSLTFAKRGYFGKRCKLVVPKEIRLPDDSSGDDAEMDNYKFSSKWGGAEEHKIKDIIVDGTPKSMTKVAGVYDLIAYLVNWQALHPFHYHQGDYRTWQETDQSKHFDRIDEVLHLGTLADQPFLPDPSPHPLHIDHRYGDVDYFERESFLVFQDDGSVQLGSGCAAHIVLAGGDLDFQAPGKVKVQAGTDFIAFSAQTCLRSKGSTDISSTDKDVRFKAEKNMQLLAGNSGHGTLLLESKGKGSFQGYHNLFGEDVAASGVVIKAHQGLAAMLAKDIYLRSGGSDLGSGDIIIDASKGNRKCYIYAKEFNTFTTDAVQFYYGPIDESSSVDKVYYFGRTTAVFDVKLLLGGKLISYDGGGGAGGLITSGGCYGLKSFGSAGVMADKKGFFLGKVPPGFAGVLSTVLSAAAQAAAALKPIGTLKHKAFYVEKYYRDGEAGNDQVIKDLHFSYRDPPGGGVQYKTTSFKWPETRWQQLERFGLASGGSPWIEKPVLYQGQETYPYPGKQKWKEDPVFLRLKELTMFDVGTGQDKNRPGPYESPHISAFDEVTMEGHYKLIR